MFRSARLFGARIRSAVTPTSRHATRIPASMTEKRVGRLIQKATQHRETVAEKEFMRMILKARSQRDRYLISTLHSALRQRKGLEAQTRRLQQYKNNEIKAKEELVRLEKETIDNKKEALQLASAAPAKPKLEGSTTTTKALAYSKAERAETQRQEAAEAKLLKHLDAMMVRRKRKEAKLLAKHQKQLALKEKALELEAFKNAEAKLTAGQRTMQEALKRGHQAVAKVAAMEKKNERFPTVAVAALAVATKSLELGKAVMEKGLEEGKGALAHRKLEAVEAAMAKGQQMTESAVEKAVTAAEKAEQIILKSITTVIDDHENPRPPTGKKPKRSPSAQSSAEARTENIPEKEAQLLKHQQRDHKDEATERMLKEKKRREEEAERAFNSMVKTEQAKRQDALKAMMAAKSAPHKDDEHISPGATSPPEKSPSESKSSTASSSEAKLEKSKRKTSSDGREAAESVSDAVITSTTKNSDHAPARQKVKPAHEHHRVAAVATPATILPPVEEPEKHTTVTNASEPENFSGLFRL